MRSFQKLYVYRLSIDFLAASQGLAAGVPRGHAEFADQLRRAAMSIPLSASRCSSAWWLADEVVSLTVGGRWGR